MHLTDSRCDSVNVADHIYLVRCAASPRSCCVAILRLSKERGSGSIAANHAAGSNVLYAPRVAVPHSKTLTPCATLSYEALSSQSSNPRHRATSMQGGHRPTQMLPDVSQGHLAVPGQPSAVRTSGGSQCPKEWLGLSMALEVAVTTRSPRVALLQVGVAQANTKHLDFL